MRAVCPSPIRGLIAACLALSLAACVEPFEDPDLSLAPDTLGPIIPGPDQPDLAPEGEWDPEAIERVVIRTQPDQATPHSTVLDIQAQVVFQEGILPDSSYQHPAVDIWECQPNTNYEGDAVFIMGRNDGGGGSACFGWPYLRFDLTGHVPAGATILQAVVSLWAETGYGPYQHGGSHKVLSAWNEASLTYNTKPPDWSNEIYESIVYITGINAWWSWDVTQMASGWQAAPASNFGLAIMPTDSLYDRSFLVWTSDDAAVLSRQPRLTVDYLLPEHRSIYLTGQPPPANMFIGQRSQVSLTFRNDGADTWTQAAGYHLGSQSPQDNLTWGRNRVELAAPVAPGGQTSFQFEVTAPLVPGSYGFQWQMVHDQVTWFGDFSPRSDIVVGTKPNGEACASGAECLSNICADSVCCDDACLAACQSCRLAGSLGNCRYIPVDQDPDDECPGSGPCGSTCNGSGSCRYGAAGTVCAICARCDGNGNCNQYEPAGTDPGGQCGLCRVCPGDGPACVAVLAGNDPLGECQSSAPQTCGLTGDCNGQAACAQHPAGTVCQPEQCLTAVHHPADLCNGTGTCVDSGSQACLPYVCRDAISCRSDCVDDSHCVAGSYCAGNQCAAYLQRGEVCGQDLECISGHCVDGVCCQTACAGTCQACNLPADPGGCLPVPDGLDPREDCPGNGPCGGVCNGQSGCRYPPTSQRCDLCTSCDGAGFCALLAPADSDPFDDCGVCSACSGQANTCRPVAGGSDPLAECPASDPLTCATTGDCDGAGACRLWPADTICVPASCQAGLLQPADLCDGSGQCNDHGQLACAPYACLGQDACRTDCAQDEDCLVGHHCQAAACEPDRTTGQACGRDGQCESRHCADGVCCDSTCDGSCQRCDLAGSLGACAAIPFGQDPDAECLGDGTCGGSCDGGGGCALPGEETACGPCARCDGQGACAVLIPAGQDPQDACGPCRVCAGDRDECLPVPAGQDPLEECEQQAPGSCDSDGVCDGRGACRLWPAGTLCGPQSCQAGVLRPPPNCDGLGNCQPQDNILCAPYGCDQEYCAGPAEMVRIRIEDAADGTGQALGDRSLTTDDSFGVWAVGLDASGASLGPVVVTWLVAGEIGSLRPAMGNSSVFDPTTPGSGWLVADFYRSDVEDGRSGDLLVAPGRAAGTFALQADPRILPADGQSTSLVTGGPVLDSDSNPVAAGTRLSVLASAGTILGVDVDPAEAGQQRASVPGGWFHFDLRAADGAGSARLRALAVAPGTAEGQGVVYFGDGRPVALAGPDQTVLAGRQVDLDGSASLDPENRMLGFAWTQQSGPPVELLGADTPRPRFTAPDPGGSQVLRFALVVSAGGESSDPDSVDITVIGSEPDLPSAVIVLDPPTGVAPLQVTADGSQSTAAACCQLSGFVWRFSDSQERFEGPIVERRFDQPAGVGVELVVIDDQGHFAIAHDQVLIGDGANLPPRLRLSASPPRGQAPLQVELHAEASDPDGRVVSLDWDFGSGWAIGGERQDKLYTQPGLHGVRVRAVDDQGLESVALISIPVSADGNFPPRILSTPGLVANVGQPWSYHPLAIGTAPLNWELGKRVGFELTRAPEGMSIDAANGALDWRPKSAQLGPVEVTLVVRNLAGADFQDFSVQVDGSPPGSGCGCQSSASRGATGWLLLLALVWLRSRRTSGRACRGARSYFQSMRSNRV